MKKYVVKITGSSGVPEYLKRLNDYGCWTTTDPGMASKYCKLEAEGLAYLVWQDYQVKATLVEELE